MKLKRLILPILLLLCTATLFSQEYIYPVKENISCMFGYKYEGEGKWLIEPKFTEASDFINGRAVVGMEGAYALIDTTGRFLHQGFYDYIDYVKNIWPPYYYHVRIEDYWGLIDRDANVVIQPAFRSISVNRTGIVSVSDTLGMYQLYHLGSKVFSQKFDLLYDCRVMGSLMNFSWMLPQPLSIVAVDNKYGLIDTNFNYIIPLILDETPSLHHFGYAIGKKNGLFGVYNFEGMVTIPHKFEYLSSFNPDSVAIYSKRGKYGLIKSNGDVLLRPRFDTISLFNAEGMALMALNSRRGNRWGVLNSKGDVVIKPRMEYIGNLSTRSWYRFIKPNTIEAGPPQVVFSRKGKKGILSAKGEVLLPAVFDDIYTSYSYQRPAIAYVINNNRLQVFKGEELIDFESFEANSFDTALVRLQGYNIVLGIIVTKTGEIISNGAFNIRVGNLHSSTDFVEMPDALPVFKNDKWGMVLRDGSMLNPAFDCITMDEYMYFYVCQGENVGVFTIGSSPVVEVIFEAVSEFVPSMNGWWVKERGIDTWMFYRLEEGLNKNIQIDYPVGIKDVGSISVNGRMGLINASLQMVLPAIYQSITELDNGNFAVKDSSGKIAFYSWNGSPLTTFEFKSVIDGPGGICLAETLNGELVYLDENAEEICRFRSFSQPSACPVLIQLYSNNNKYSNELSLLPINHESPSYLHVVNNAMVNWLFRDYLLPDYDNDYDLGIRGINHFSGEWQFEEEYFFRYESSTVHIKPVVHDSLTFTILAQLSQSFRRFHSQTYSHETFILSENGYVKISMDDILDFELDKAAFEKINDYVIEGIREKEGVDVGYCANPDNWLELASGRFVISKLGIEVIVPVISEGMHWHEESEEGIRVLLPWEILKPVLVESEKTWNFLNSIGR